MLWNEKTYPKWTSAFTEGSHAESDWKEGNLVKFLGPENNGILSKIKENRPSERMCFEHMGCIIDGSVRTVGAEADLWKGVREIYTLKTADDHTELLVETDIPEEYLASFEEAFPQALYNVKELAEG